MNIFTYSNNRESRFLYLSSISIKAFGALLSIVLIVACGGNKSIVSPTTTPLFPILTSTSTVKPTQSVTKTPTPLPTNSLTQNITPKMESALGNCPETNWLSPQLSPDGQWVAASCEAGDLSHLKIVSVNGSQAWEPSFEEITGLSPCLGFTNRFGEANCFWGVMYINHWDQNSRYIFVDINYLVDRYFDFSFGLYRLDLQTHHISPWLKATQEFPYTYAFSPDNKFIAYCSSVDGFIIHVDSIESGQVNNYQVPGHFIDVANFVWSSDNSKLAFSLLHKGWDDKTGGLSLALLDIKKGKISVLIANDLRQFYPVGWSSETIIDLQNRTGLLRYQYDFQLNELLEKP